MDFVSERMRSIPFSDIRQLFERVSELKSRGISLVPFHIGQPDFDTPVHIKQAAVDALQQGMTAYTSNYGLPALREAIAAKLSRENNLPVESIQAMPGIRLVPPQGAFYAFPNVKKLAEDSEQVSQLLLERANIAVVPGKAFGGYGQGFIRLSFACSLPEIEEGMNSLAHFCQDALASSPAA